MTFLAWIARNPAWTIAAILALSCGGLYGLTQHRTAQRDAARAEVATHKANFDTAIQANKNLAANLQEVSRRYDKLLDEVKADREQMAAFAKSIRETTSAIQANFARIRASREEIIRDPSCAQLAAIDIVAQCPLLAASLREQARREGRGNDRGQDPR